MFKSSEAVVDSLHGLLGFAVFAEKLLATGDQNAVGSRCVACAVAGLGKHAELLDDVAVGLGNAHFVKTVDQQDKAATPEQVQKNGRVTAFASLPLPVVVQQVAEAGLVGKVAQVDQ